MRKIDLAGMKFGKLSVLSKSQSIKMPCGSQIVHWLCRCECGIEKFIDSKTLRIGRAKSCGCNRPYPPIPVPIPNFGAFKNRLYNRYRSSAKNRNLEFNIPLDVFLNLIGSNCFYCNLPPDKEKKHGGQVFSYLGLDRRNSNSGYTIDNVVPCCWACNVAKYNSSESEFLNHVIRIYNHRCKNV